MKNQEGRPGVRDELKTGIRKMNSGGDFDSKERIIRSSSTAEEEGGVLRVHVNFPGQSIVPQLFALQLLQDNNPDC